MSIRAQITLVGLAMVAAIIAGVATRATMKNTRLDAPSALMPGFASRAEDAARIEIVTRIETLRLTRQGDGWVLPDRTGISAQREKVRALLLGLADLTPVETKTADPASYPRIGVTDPAEPDSRGTRVTVHDDAGAELASIILGDFAEGGSGVQRRFVRVAGEAQSYVAPVSFDATTEVSQWTDRTLLRVDGDRVQSVVIANPGDTEFALSRPTPDQPDFEVEPLPPGRTLRSPGVANPISRALSNLMFEDVRPDTNPIDPDQAVSVVYQTFDGLVIALLIGNEEGARWTTITVSAADPHNPPEDYESLRARVAGRQFQLPTWAATNMSKRLQDLLAPPSAGSDTPEIGPVLDPGG